MSEAGFEPTITASERAKTFHTLDRSVTVTGRGRDGGSKPNEVSARIGRNPCS
jgi:hypothetical protein